MPTPSGTRGWAAREKANSYVLAGRSRQSLLNLGFSKPSFRLACLQAFFVPKGLLKKKNYSGTLVKEQSKAGFVLGAGYHERFCGVLWWGGGSTQDRMGKWGFIAAEQGGGSGRKITGRKQQG